MKKEYLLATFTVFCWGTLPAVTKLTLLHISNMQVLFISSLIATVSLLLYLLFTGRIMGFRSLRRVDLVQLTALGFLGNFLYSAFYYAGVRMLPTADASTVNYLWPVIASVSAVLILKEKINRSGWLAIIVSFLGVTVISSGGTGPTFKNIHGVALCAAGAFCYGIFNVLNKKKGLDQHLCTTVYFAVTALFSGIVFFTTESFLPMSASTWAGMIWLGVLIDACAILSWGLALQGENVSFLSNFAYATPVAATVISFVLLKEPIEIYALIGMSLVLFGCGLQIYARKSNHS